MRQYLVPIVEATAAGLFWLQATRVLFSALFGVVYDAVFGTQVPFLHVGLIFLFVLAAFASPGFAARRACDPNRGRMGLFLSILAASVARVPLTIDEPRIRFASAILVIGATSTYLALFLPRRPGLVPSALVLALSMDQTVRVIGDTWDISLQARFLPLQIALCLGLIGVAWAAYSQRRDPDQESLGGHLGAGGALALGAFLFLETNVLAQPNVLARWTGTRYELVAPLLLAVTAFPLLFITRGRFDRFGGLILQRFSSCGVLVRGIWLVVGVIGGLILGRLHGGLVGMVALLLVQIVLVMIVPLMLQWPTLAQDGKGASKLPIAMLGFFFFNLIYALAFTYPYTIPALRDSGLVIVGGALFLALVPAVLRPPAIVPLEPTPLNHHILLLLAFGMIYMAIWSRPIMLPGREPGETVRVATYNIHYGYDSHWHHSLEDQARAVEESGAEIVFLQEVDAGRITSYGVDHAFWLARRLNMHASFAPTLEGLSGVALLSRLAVLDSSWILLPSALEQTALVHASIRVNDGILHTYGVWFGLEAQERMDQLDAALARIGKRDPCILGGDMNSLPDSPIYTRLKAAGFLDPFDVLGNLPAYTSPSVDPSERIDYVWVRGAEPFAAWVSPSLASDHRLVVVSINTPE